MQCAVYAFADEASPLMAGQIAAMRRNGLQGLEIRGVDGVNVADISDAKAREVRRALDDAGLVTWSIGSPIGKIDIETGDHRLHLEKMRRVLEIADILGCARVRMFSYYIPAGRDPAEFRGAVLDRLGELLRAAEGTGIRLCHENEKGIYGDNAARCADLLQALPALGGVFDPANFIQCGQETWEAWELLRERIDYLHIKDAVADGTVVPAGKGLGQVGRIVADYLSRGGAACTVEPHLGGFVGLKGLERAGEKTKLGFAYPDSDAAFDAACAALKTLLA